MDRLWLPSTWQANVLRKHSRHQEIPIVPWPQHSEPAAVDADLTRLSGVGANPPMTLDQLASYRTRVAPPGEREAEKRREEAQARADPTSRYEPARARSLAEVLPSYWTRFLAIQTDAPRKGLPLLLAAWFSYLSEAAGRACLIIKTSSLDVGADVHRQHFHNSLAVRRAATRWREASPNVFFVYDRLSDVQLSDLTLSCDAMVSASMGEGFGGPIADALLHERPVIAPRHTSLADLLPSDYPFAVRYETRPLKLWLNIPIYSPSSPWRVIDEQHMAEVMGEVAAARPSELRMVARAARAHLLAATEMKIVTQKLASEFALLDTLRAAA
jgi:hypothetical protein